MDDDTDQTVEMLERLGGDLASPSPATAGLVARGRLERRRRTRLRAAGCVVAAAVAVVGAVVLVPHGGPTAEVAGPGGVRVVTDPADVAGEWKVVEVDGKAPPADASTLVSLGVRSVEPRELLVSFSADVNSYAVTITVADDGTLTPGQMGGSDVGCAHDPCGHPGGFGIEDAAELGLTDDGRLVLLADGGRELAVYEHVPQVDQADPDARVVTDVADVAGTWAVTEVDGHAPPADAERGLRMEHVSHVPGRGSATYADGSGSYNVTFEIRSSGELVRGNVVSLGVACPPAGCRPAGFGVFDAVGLRLTPDGRMILVGPGGEELAVYERSS